MKVFKVDYNYINGKNQNLQSEELSKAPNYVKANNFYEAIKKLKSLDFKSIEPANIRESFEQLNVLE